MKNIKLIRCLSPSQAGCIVDLNNLEQMDRFHNAANHRAHAHGIYPEKIHQQSSIMKQQVGGKSDSKIPMLTIQPNYILKPLQSDHRGLREMVFYEIVTIVKQIFELFDHGRTNAKQNKWITWFELVFEWILFQFYGYIIDTKWYRDVCHLNRLSEFIPEYHGVVHNDEHNAINANMDINALRLNPHPYIILKDETIPFNKPCIMDLKIGTITYEPDAKPSKKESQRKKYPQQEEFGFRIVGMKVYDPYHPEACQSTGYRTIDKFGGRQLTTHNSMVHAIESFFTFNSRAFEKSVATQSMQTIIIKDFLTKLIKLRTWFLENESFAFYASSLLLIYEGARTIPNQTNTTTTLKMIDFAHVRKCRGNDVGYLHGLDVIISILNDITQSHEQVEFTADR